MTFDMFSVFDSGLFYVTPLFLALLLTKLTSTSLSRLSSFVTWPLLENSKFTLSGGSVLITSLFFIILTMNFSGLIPHVYSLTTHLSTNMSMSLPAWLAVCVAAMSFSPMGLVAHMQPLGAPGLLAPFLCLIELVSLLIRPLTLAVRLAANLTTGHIFIALLAGLPCPASIIGGAAYLTFELGIAAIQTYIFTVLPVLYFDETPYHMMT